jgi:predicted ATP-grasp superfamily ATP-dependent carboligase
MPPKLVIIATSGRALAQSAAKRRRQLVVLDAFADRDTRAAAAVARVAADEGIALDAERLLTALAAQAQESAPDIVIGGGLEHAPGLASRIAAHGRLYANPPATVAALKDPELGTALLRATGWDVPVTQRDAPADRRGWLQKQAGGTGGVHVRRAGNAPADARGYFQREVRGQPMSVTFLADGERAWLLGFNRLRTAARGEAAFRYGGAVGNIAVAPPLCARTQSCLDRLVRVTGLRGLAGVDFLLAAGESIAIEINPRPTATFELYDDDFPEGLVHWHMLSFERPVPELAERVGRERLACRALGIIYADQPVRIPADAGFPDWCRDLPCGETTIAAGAPVLSVFAEAETAEEAERLLGVRTRAVHELLARWVGTARRAVA